jgi:hypothetical protein
MVSMEMEETANGGDLYGPQVSRAMQSVMAPSHSVTMQGFMYHAMPKSGRKFPCKMCSQVNSISTSSFFYLNKLKPKINMISNVFSQKQYN